mmetsp:Transcript_23972/g.80867  ORF Transcript_23972/g.80867 Transcript_23972/m.80867 type:complete len:233 (+) Transcript_23972:472-1170(+)
MCARALTFACRSSCSNKAWSEAARASKPGCARTAAAQASAVSLAWEESAPRFSSMDALARASRKSSSSSSSDGGLRGSIGLRAPCSCAAPPPGTSGSCRSVSTSTLARAILLGEPSPMSAARAKAWMTARSSDVAGATTIGGTGPGEAAEPFERRGAETPPRSSRARSSASRMRSMAPRASLCKNVAATWRAAVVPSNVRETHHHGSSSSAASSDASASACISARRLRSSSG